MAVNRCPVSEACSGLSFQSIIEEKGLQPDSDILFGTTLTSWNEFCEVVAAYNERFPAKAHGLAA